MRRILTLSFFMLFILSSGAQIVVRNLNMDNSIVVEKMSPKRTYQMRYVAFEMIKNRFDLNTQRQTSGMLIFVTNDNPSHKERHDDENIYVRSDLGFIGKCFKNGKQEFFLMTTPDGEKVLDIVFYPESHRDMTIIIRENAEDTPISEMKEMKKITIRNSDAVPQIFALILNYYNSGKIYTRDFGDS